MKRTKTVMNIAYDRQILIASLEKAKARELKKNEELQKKLKTAAINKLKADIQAIKSGVGDVSVYVDEGEVRGTYYQPVRKYYDAFPRRFDLVLKQLRLSDTKKIRLGQADSEWVLQFIDVPE